MNKMIQYTRQNLAIIATFMFLVLSSMPFTALSQTQHTTNVASATAASVQSVVEHDGEEKGEFSMQNLIFNHINNSNEFHLFGHVSVPLPCILYSKEDGLTFFMSSKLDHGHKAFNRYVIYEGVIKRVKDVSFPSDHITVDGITHKKENNQEIAVVSYNGKKYETEGATTMLQGSSFYDFSISKNVFSMILAAIILCIIFSSVANAYKKRQGLAPSGLQNLMEIIISFIIDEVAKPMLGNRYMKYLPYLLTIFFFILVCNLMGLIPFFPFSANITGNIATTMALAVLTFIITNISGNAGYWKHIFWIPGVPVPMKIFLAPIEFLGIFIKPISLMIRLFANITAGHIIILSLIGLIFVFGKVGESMGGAVAGASLAIPFTLFMNLIELVVALIQAFIFTILSASYIGAATEEAHH